MQRLRLGALTYDRSVGSGTVLEGRSNGTVSDVDVRSSELLRGRLGVVVEAFRTRPLVGEIIGERRSEIERTPLRR